MLYATYFFIFFALASKLYSNERAGLTMACRQMKIEKSIRFILS